MQKKLILKIDIDVKKLFFFYRDFILFLNIMLIENKGAFLYIKTIYFL